MTSLKVFGILCLIATTWAVPAQDGTRTSRNVIQTENDLLDSVYQDCLKKDMVSCMKYKVFSVVDKVLGQTDISISDGVQIVKTSESEKLGAPRALNGDESLEGVMLNKVANFMGTHSIKLELNGKELLDLASTTARGFSESFYEEEEEDEEVEDENAVGEARGKIKKKKIKKIKKVLGPVFKIVALKAALLMKLAIIGIALIAGKALIVSKIALVLALILAAKKLFASKLGGGLGGLGGGLGGGFGGGAIHTSSHVGGGHEIGGYGGDVGGYGGGYGGGHGGWGRSTDAQELAYKGYAQAQQA